MDRFWDYFCKICLIIFILICINSILGDVLFRLKYSFPKISSRDNTIIETKYEPSQKNLDGKKYIKAYGENNTYALNLQAEYSISALVVAKNNNFWFRDIMRSKFDDICLIDFGFVWGDLAADKKKLYKHIKFNSKKH